MQDTATHISSTQDLQNDSASHMVDTGTFTMDSLTACAVDQWLVLLAQNGSGVGVGSPSYGTLTTNISATQTEIDASNFSDESVSIVFGPISGTGTYPISQVGEVILHNPTAGTTGTVTITSYGPVGGYIIGTFTGQVEVYQGLSGYVPPMLSCSGYFQVKRTQ